MTFNIMKPWRFSKKISNVQEIPQNSAIFFTSHFLPVTLYLRFRFQQELRRKFLVVGILCLPGNAGKVVEF